MSKGTIVTEKQKKVLEGIVKGKTKKQAMLDAGYKESYANNGNIKKTETWSELESKYFNDKKVSKALEKLLNSTEIKVLTFPGHLKKEEVYKNLLKIGYRKKDVVIFIEDLQWKCYIRVINGTDVSNGTDRILKIKGRYAPEQVEFDIGGLSRISDKDLDKMIEEREIEIGIRKRKK